MADESVDSLVIPVRLIRSLQHRNIKTIVLKDVPSDITVRDFEERVEKGCDSYFTFAAAININIHAILQPFITCPSLMLEKVVRYVRKHR